MLKYYITPLLLFPLLSAGAEFRYSVNSSIANSDNIQQVANGDEGEIYEAGFDFTLNSTENREWELNLDSGFLLTRYSGELANQQQKRLQGVVRYQPTAANFSANLLGNISQVPRNRFSIEGVDNLRDIQVVAINPAYFFRLNSIDRLNFSASAIDLKSEDPEGTTQVDDSRRTYEYAVSYQKRLSQINSVSINFREASNDFVDQLAEDYDQRDLFLNLTIAGLANQLQLEYGLTEITNDFNQNNPAEFNYSRLSYTRQVNRMQSFQLSYFDGVDRVLGADSASSGNVSVQANNALTAQEIKDYRFDYTINSTYIQSNFGYAKRKLRQLGQEQDEREEIYDARLSYSTSRLFSTPLNSGIVLTYRLSRRGFEDNINNPNVNATETERYSLQYNHAYSTRLVFFIAFIQRDASQENFNSDITNANNSKSVQIGFTYSDRGRW